MSIPHLRLLLCWIRHSIFCDWFDQLTAEQIRVHKNTCHQAAWKSWTKTNAVIFHLILHSPHLLQRLMGMELWWPCLWRKWRWEFRFISMWPTAFMPHQQLKVRFHTLFSFNNQGRSNHVSKLRYLTEENKSIWCTWNIEMKFRGSTLDAQEWCTFCNAW